MTKAPSARTDDTWKAMFVDARVEDRIDLPGAKIGCPVCRAEIRIVPCPQCGASPFEHPAGHVEQWAQHGWTFRVSRVPASLPGATHVADPFFERALADVFERSATSQAASWLLARMVRLAGGTTTMLLVQRHTHERRSYYQLDLLVGRESELLGTITILAGADFVTLRASAHGDIDALVAAFVASLAAQPHELASVVLRVEGTSLHPDPDRYVRVPPRNVYGWDGTKLLGEDNEFHTRTRPPPDPVDAGIAHRVLELTKVEGGCEVRSPATWPPSRNVSNLLRVGLAGSWAVPLVQLTVPRPDPGDGFAGAIEAARLQSSSLRRLCLGAEIRSTYVSLPPLGEPLPAGYAGGFVETHRLDSTVDLRGVNLPALEQLVAYDVTGLRIVAASLPQLRQLTLRVLLEKDGAPLELAELAALDLPELEVLWLHGARRGVHSFDAFELDLWREQTALLGGRFPKLRRLVISAPFDEKARDILVSSPLLATLEEIIWGGVNLTEAELEIGHRPASAHLEPQHARALEHVHYSLGSNKHRAEPREPKRSPRVRHPKFGAGKVIEVVENATEPTWVIEFADGATRKLHARFVEKISDS